jgi:PKD repeat protein
MRKSAKLRTKSDQRNPQSNSKSLNWKAIAIALYITFLLLSTIALTAERNLETKMEESYTYHLRYPKDGRQTHYYVERLNTSEIGKIDLTYTTKSNTLDVECYNIKVLHIFCRSMYEDECRDVYGIDPSDNSNYYKWYFIEKNHFNVNIESDTEIEELEFIDTPLAYEVIVNGLKWKESEDYFYNSNGSLALSNVPSGSTRVDLYFKPRTGFPPVAVLEATKTVVPVDYPIDFDASKSVDPDGTISAYILDLGDGTFKGGETNSYSYSKPGVYGVILTVRDNDNLLDHDFVNITVVKSSNLPEIQGIVPDQEMPEDSPPWTLNLTTFEPMAITSGIDFYWYITGEDESLYSIVGENSTVDRFIFQPVPNAYGSNLVTLWLRNAEDVADSQPLWINITPVNDPPLLQSLPDLVVHYDDPYTFNYHPYVNDIDTPKDQLILDIFDGFEKKYIAINGLNATYNYPHELVGEIIYATVMVSDGDKMAQDVISIQVTSDYVPKRIKELPDIWLYEGTTKYDVFDLDDYFTDPDNDAIYFSYGFTHLNITIYPDHTVDISADSEWTGSELVTFRARDPIGALAEDTIIVTVLPVNDPPIIEGVPNFYVHYDHDYRFDLTPYVHDNDNKTEQLRIITSDTEHIRQDSYNNMVIIMNYPVDFLGETVVVRLTVSDGLDSAFQFVAVTITKDFPPELITPLPDIVFLEDSPLNNVFDLDYYFRDIDGDLLYYTTGNDFVNITINTDNTVDLSAPIDWFGSELISFRATDPTGGLMEDIVLVTVLPINDAPFILPIPEQYGNESQRWALDLTPYIFDVDDNISELEISVDNDFVVVSGSTLIFIGSKEMPNDMLVTVSDGKLSAEQVVVIHLTLAQPPKATTIYDLFLNILPFLILIILIILAVAGLVYRKKSHFLAEEVFLIHKNGTLITHLSRNAQANVDDIIFSGMFTAVQDFIKDTFVSDDDTGGDKDADDESKWALDELKLGENNILIERSKYTYLAVIFSGEGSKRLRRIISKLLGKIEIKYKIILPKWSGNTSELKGTREILSVLIKSIEPTTIEPPTPKPTQPPTPVTKFTEKTPEPKPIPTQVGFIGIPQPTLQSQGSIFSQLGSSPTHAPKPKLSTPMTTAQPVLKQTMSTPSKDLQHVVREQTGAQASGLTPWPVTKRDRYNKIQAKNRKNRLPRALNIFSKLRSPKTVALNRRQVMRGAKQNQQNLPPVGIHTTKPKNVQIPMPGHRTKFKVDPSKPLLQQLAEYEDKK